MGKIMNWKNAGTEFPLSKYYIVRYYNTKSFRMLQLSRYRDADASDRSLKTSYPWHGKWYVNVWGGGSMRRDFEKLFNTKQEAIAFAMDFMRGHTNG